MNGKHFNIVNMIVDNKINTFADNKSQQRLFNIYAETKSVKDFQREDVQFAYPEYVRSTITIEFQKDGHIFASTHGDHSIKIVDFETGTILRTLIGHPRTPWTVRFHPRNPDILVSGCLGSYVIVWNWRKNEAIARTMIMHNVMIPSLDWHPTKELILITCGTTVYIWDYINGSLINLFPNSVRRYQFAFFYGDGREFIASHEKEMNRGQPKTFTITRYQLVKDKYTNTVAIYGYNDITEQSTVNCSNGIHISKNGDYAIISICEKPQTSQSIPDIPPVSLLQLQSNYHYNTPATLPEPSLPSLGAAALPLPTPDNSHSSLRSSIFPTLAPSTPPVTRSFHSLSTPPPLHSRPPSDLSATLPHLPFLQPPPPVPTLRPQAVPQFQQIHYSNKRTKPFFYPRYIAKVCLIGVNAGKIVSRFKIPDDALVSSLQISPSNDFILASYRIKNDDEEDFTSVYFHIYRQSDWRLYYEAKGYNDNANIAVWSPMMNGVVVGTEKGKLIIFRSVISPLSKYRLKDTSSDDEAKNDNHDIQ